MKYIKVFTQDSDYQSFASGGGVSLPNMSYCKKEKEVHYTPLILQPNNEIWYTSTNGNIVTPYSGATTPFLDADGNEIPIISNTYENGKGIIKLEKDCYQIGDRAFSNCSSLTEINIPNSIILINARAFQSCESLTEITIPDKATTIGVMAFANCSSLTGITIPNSVTSIGSSAFIACSKLSSITVKPEEPPALGSNAFDDIASNAVIYVPNPVYATSYNWENYRSKMKVIE